MTNSYTTIAAYDGFGAQYNRIIQTYIVCKMNNNDFLYTPIKCLDHNYNRDPNFVNDIENFINLKNNIPNNTNLVAKEIGYTEVIQEFFEKNIDEYCESKYMRFIKDCFWENKDRDFFSNGKINVAVHIRRGNICDNGQAGDRITTPNGYYLNIMNKIRREYNNNNLLFHIYSQGNLNNFTEFKSDDVIFYLNDDVMKSFMGMVSADILVISPSALSYVAGLISDGTVYYKPFWHKPLKNWIIQD